MTLISTACSWVSILGGQKAAIIAQVGQFYFDEVGQYYSGANNLIQAARLQVTNRAEFDASGALHDQTLLAGKNRSRAFMQIRSRSWRPRLFAATMHLLSIQCFMCTSTRWPGQ